jgi:hypothetical protein
MTTPPDSRLSMRTASGTLDELRAALDRARDLIRDLESVRTSSALRDGGAASGEAVAPAEVARLEEELAAAEIDRGELSSRLVDAERQAGQLMNLYVATYQLHATLDPADVKSTIAEIAVDLLGAQRFALLLRSEPGGPAEVALARGLSAEQNTIFEAGSYRGGEPMIDAVLADGVLRLAPFPGSTAVAVVPLTVQEDLVGVLAVLELLPHKPALLSSDRDILDLLAAHAASALVAARVYAQTDRKLRTLESLVKLMRGA